MLIQTLLRRTSFPGLSQWSARTGHRARMWLVLALFGIGLTCFPVYRVMEKYFEYPVRTKVSQLDHPLPRPETPV